MDPRAPLPEVVRAPERGRVLVFAPHADDEVIGCGGTLALHALQGDPVRVVVAFDGGAAAPGGPLAPAELARVRRAEALAGGRELGVLDYAFLGHPEGHAPTEAELEAGARELARELERHAPATLYAPWIGERHLDHHVLARATRRALELARFDGRALAYEVWTPLLAERVVDVSGVVERKRAALLRHASQRALGALAHRAFGSSAQPGPYLPDGRSGEAFARFPGRSAGAEAA